jgi:ABC-2 type transport system permease protein
LRSPSWSSIAANAGWWCKVADSADFVGACRVGGGGERFRPYRMVMKAQLRAQLNYRASFSIEAIGGMILTGLDLVTVLVVFNVTSVLGGFSFREAFLMSAVANVSFAAGDQLVGSIDDMRVQIRTGLLDALLVRPLGLLRQLVSMDFQLRRIGRVLESVVVLAVAAGLAHVAVSPATIVLVVLAVIAGTAFFAAFLVMAGTVSFWWIDSAEFGAGFTYGGRNFTLYPMTVYGQVFRYLFAYGLGFAFVAYYPVLTLLHRSDPLGLPTWTGWLTPLVSVAVCGIAAYVWRTGVRHYRSTGS